MIPRFGSESVSANESHIYGSVIKNNCSDPEMELTYTVWSHGSHPPDPVDFTYVWSSYRYVASAN